MPLGRASSVAKRELQAPTPIRDAGEICLHFQRQSALQSLVVIAR
jgi:hypothetical protein